VLYIDSSALLKLLWQEPESEAVRDHVASEDHVIVSSLAEPETHVQLTAAWLAGRYGKPRHCRTLDRLHLAAMTELDVARLMTHDAVQAQAARALGFEVVIPGRRANQDG
jgi:uncharacterized protein with PIN domain